MSNSNPNAEARICLHHGLPDNWMNKRLCSCIMFLMSVCLLREMMAIHVLQILSSRAITLLLSIIRNKTTDQRMVTPKQHLVSPPSPHHTYTYLHPPIIPPDTLPRASQTRSMSTRVIASWLFWQRRDSRDSRAALQRL